MSAEVEYMKKDRIAVIIQKINDQYGKFYTFQEEHNPRLPGDYWFQHPPEGLTLFLVLYTRSCRWARCAGCNLPSLVSQFHVPFSDIMKQVDYIFDFMLSGEQKQKMRKIILSNNGSVLDEDTFSTTALLYFVAKMNINCPGISVLTLETRPEYVDLAELEVLHRALQEGPTSTALELAIGFEAFDDRIRNDVFNKGMSLEGFENLVQQVAQYGFHLKTYFMLKPVPGLSDDESIADVVRGIDYLDGISRKFNIKINMHLNPTYVSSGTILETEFNKGNYLPPTLEMVRKTVLSAKNKCVSIYVGLNDEGLAVPGGSFIRPGDEDLQEKLLQFNHSGDFSWLE
jgi:radical SAM enzyme (TIGR01210 family)